VQPPVLGAVIAEISAKDFEVLARRIRERGGSITVSELEDMHVAVELADDLRAALRRPATGTPRPGDIRARPGITTENA
jgi:hypothetical protein